MSKAIGLALAKAQMSMGKALKDSTNPHFKSKYADLSSVMDACLPALNENGIAVIQPTTDDEGGRYVTTTLIHGESGEELSCRVPLIVAKNDMQGYGSAVTYARRYGLMAMAGIAPDDDDGNEAAKPPPPRPQERSWAQTITDELPEGATARDKAVAISEALIAQWERKPSEGQLNNEWERRKSLIESLRDKHADLFSQVADAFDLRIQEVTDAKHEAEK